MLPNHKLCEEPKEPEEWVCLKKRKKKEIDEICEVIKEESSIDNAMGIYNDMVKALFDRMFPEIEKRLTVRKSVKWLDSEIKTT